MSREVHLVGTLPAETGEDAMTLALDRLGPHLRRVSDGETDLRAWWIRAHVAGFYGHPGLELTRDGDYSSYEKTPRWKVRDGHEMTAESVDDRLVQFGAFVRSYPVFKRVRERYGKPDLSFQVGTPTHVDMATSSFEDPFSEAVYRPLLEGVALHSRRIQEAQDGDVIFQLETTRLLSVAFAPAEEREAKAAEIAAMIAELPALMPTGTRFGIHTCLGDMNHTAAGHASDASPMILFANALAAAWPEGRPLEFIHAPFAAAHEPPAEDDAFYEPLALLDLPESVTFYAGCVHESLSAEEQGALVELIEAKAGRKVGVAAACGLGRRPNIEQAWDAIDKSARLAD